MDLSGGAASVQPSLNQGQQGLDGLFLRIVARVPPINSISQQQISQIFFL